MAAVRSPVRDIVRACTRSVFGAVTTYAAFLTSASEPFKTSDGDAFLVKE
jgi:hypothetical protein